ncbi:hypothetical protein F5Y15DRAFT_64130 [Xylariaceae sp. FL0016]|nr:hypothetical protein F5Y15DRAFT_64130 [Xylariaceae sp. FL0016]
MSRVLEKELLSGLKTEDSYPVYQDISHLLTHPSDNGRLEIEFLGKSYPLQPGVNFLQDGLAIAIPKLRLVQAFLVARQILQSYLERGSQTGNDNVVAATAVLLLMDPEHLTAANTRKREILSKSENGKPKRNVLEDEMNFVDTLLTSRLHRHTKSPTLWSHRRWLLGLWTSFAIPLNIQSDIRDVVMVAGERHPRNYVAWHHARLLLGKEPHVAEEIAIDIKEFCLRHHSDTSGWSFLNHTINLIEEEARHKTCSLLLEDILKVTDSFRWTNESLWVFLRTVMATGYVSQDIFESFVSVNKNLRSSLPKDSPQWQVLDKAMNWCTRYRMQLV